MFQRERCTRSWKYHRGKGVSSRRGFQGIKQEVKTTPKVGSRKQTFRTSLDQPVNP